MEFEATDRHHREIGKRARLRAGEAEASDVSLPVVEPADFRQLRQLRELDEQLESAAEADSPQLLDDLDRTLIDEALGTEGINYYRIGKALGLNRSTVWRRLKQLLTRAGYLQEFAQTLLDPGRLRAGQKEWLVMKAMLKAFAYHRSPGTVMPKDILSLADFHRLNRMQQGRAAARRCLYPLIGLKLQRQGDKIIITGSGRLDRKLKEAVRSGKAERIYDPPRCQGCGRFLEGRTRGRPRKWCSGARGERCRKRFDRARGA